MVEKNIFKKKFPWIQAQIVIGPYSSWYSKSLSKSKNDFYSNIFEGFPDPLYLYLNVSIHEAVLDFGLLACQFLEAKLWN